MVRESSIYRVVVVVVVVVVEVVVVVVVVGKEGTKIII